MEVKEWVKALFYAVLDIFSYSFVEKIGIFMAAGVTGVILEVITKLPNLGYVFSVIIPFGVFLKQNKNNLKRKEKTAIVKTVFWILVIVGFSFFLLTTKKL